MKRAEAALVTTITSYGYLYLLYIESSEPLNNLCPEFFGIIAID